MLFLILNKNILLLNIVRRLTSVKLFIRLGRCETLGAKIINIKQILANLKLLISLSVLGTFD